MNKKQLGLIWLSLSIMFFTAIFILYRLWPSEAERQSATTPTWFYWTIGITLLIALVIGIWKLFSSSTGLKPPKWVVGLVISCIGLYMVYAYIIRPLTKSSQTSVRQVHTQQPHPANSQLIGGVRYYNITINSIPETGYGKIELKRGGIKTVYWFNPGTDEYYLVDMYAEDSSGEKYFSTREKGKPSSTPSRKNIVAYGFQSLTTNYTTIRIATTTP